MRSRPILALPGDPLGVAETAHLSEQGYDAFLYRHD